jgi:Spy/CpxP family protein refolding chaperone
MKAYKTEFVGLLSALGLLSLLAFATSAGAEDGPRHGPGFDGPMFISERMADRLELDDVQRAQVRNILEAAKPEFEALRDRVKTEIEAVLTEEQLAELEQMKHHRRGGPNRRAKPESEPESP